jgi:hypothetical protein
MRHYVAMETGFSIHLAEKPVFPELKLISQGTDD